MNIKKNSKFAELLGDLSHCMVEKGMGRITS